MTTTLKMLAALALAVVMGGNGLAMLAAGRWWYGAVPGVTETGPFNPHFVKDIGAAYLVCGLAFAWRAGSRLSPAAAGATIAAAAFLGFHALVHVGDEIAGPGGLDDFIRDFPGVFLPAILAAGIAWPARQAS